MINKVILFSMMLFLINCKSDYNIIKVSHRSQTAKNLDSISLRFRKQFNDTIKVVSGNDELLFFMNTDTLHSSEFIDKFIKVKATKNRKIFIYLINKKELLVIKYKLNVGIPTSYYINYYNNTWYVSSETPTKINYEYYETYK